MAAGGEFVDGWIVAQILGEGAYGEVRLLVHARSGASVALKSVVSAGAGPGGAGAGAAREAALQRALRHPHVLRCLGARQHDNMHYMFLEYAEGGELFDRIEPDVGMPEGEARRYWRQLLAGVGYLHSRGVAHRDIKPENLLLDKNLNLKISDFGMATIFRHGSRERLVRRVCGTVPYAAPEVLAGAGQGEGYRAEPADLWACAVVLLASLAGELPWERAHESDPRYSAWSAWLAAGGRGAGPGRGEGPGRVAGPGGVWGKLPAAARALLARALQPHAPARAALPALLADPWTTQQEPHYEGKAASRAWCSQPGDTGADELSAADMEELVCRSQPAQLDDLVLASQLDCTAGTQRPDALQRLARRLTRVRLAGSAGQARAALEAALRALSCTWRVAGGGGGALVVRASDGGSMRVWLWHEPGHHCVLEVRRERGCGLAFRRRFLRLRDLLRPITATDPDLPPPPAFSL